MNTFLASEDDVCYHPMEPRLVGARCGLLFISCDIIHMEDCLKSYNEILSTETGISKKLENS